MAQPSHPDACAQAPEATAQAAAFDVLLEHEQRVLEGAPADFEALCAAHPALSSALRRLRSGASLSPAPTPQRERIGELAQPADGAAHDSAKLLALASSDRARAARYERRAELGRGAMGVVYEVWDRELARPLAMKVLAASSFAARDPAAHAQRLQRFLREVRTAAQLDHPGIVPVHDFGLDEQGRPFFTMKRVQGRELKQVFADVWCGEGDWTLARAVAALLKVCEALEFAHAKGVVHRDLKPANVMIGPFGEVFVMDWGVAHLLDGVDERATGGRAGEGDSELTDDGDVLGTASYMAPEQALGKLAAIGPALDVYALGAMLYHLLAARAPYTLRSGSNSTAAVLTRLLSGPPQPLAELAPRAPVELVAIAEKAMAREVERRYEHVRALGADLRAWLEGRVVGAHDVGAWTQLKKWIARNRALSLASAGGLAALLLGALVAAWLQSLRADDALAASVRIGVERDNANAAAERARIDALTAERTTGFFESLFEELDPSGEGGQSLTVRRFLDSAAERLSGELADEPGARARLMGSMAAAYGGVGAASQSLAAIGVALGDAQRAHGPSSEQVLELRRRQAALQLAAGQWSAAREALEGLAGEFERRGRASSSEALENQRALALALAQDGDPLRAEELLASALSRAEQAGSISPSELARWRLDLLQLLVTAGRASEAVDQASCWLSTQPSLDAATRASVERWLAGALELLGDWAGAEQALRAALGRLEAAPGAKLRELGVTRRALGRRLILESRWREGDVYVIPPEHRARCEEGVELLRVALADLDQVLDAHAPQQVDLAQEIAQVLYDLGRWHAARPYGERALRAHRSSGAPFGLGWSRSLNLLAKLHIALGEWELAEPLARERLELAPPDDPHMADRRALLERIRAHLSPSTTTERD